MNVVGKNHVLNKSFAGKLHMIDLAGSERIYKSEAEGERMKEACSINQSLTTLGKVLNGLATKNSHIPYRESKLTHLLKESLGGSAKTLLIIQCSPNPRDMGESISTLQFGTRVMKVEKGKAKQNFLETTFDHQQIKGKHHRNTQSVACEINLKQVAKYSAKEQDDIGSFTSRKVSLPNQSPCREDKENIPPLNKQQKRATKHNNVHENAIFKFVPSQGEQQHTNPSSSYLSHAASAIGNEVANKKLNVSTPLSKKPEREAIQPLNVLLNRNAKYKNR